MTNDELMTKPEARNPRPPGAAGARTFLSAWEAAHLAERTRMSALPTKVSTAASSSDSSFVLYPSSLKLIPFTKENRLNHANTPHPRPHCR